MWLGMNSSANKQRRLMGELHTRMTAGPANVGTDRTGLRTAYLPALRASLVRPLITAEQEGIPAVIATMQARRARPVRSSACLTTGWVMCGRGNSAKQCVHFTYPHCCIGNP